MEEKIFNRFQDYGKKLIENKIQDSFSTRNL